MSHSLPDCHTETDIKWSLLYDTAPGIEYLELIVTQQSTLLMKEWTFFGLTNCFTSAFTSVFSRREKPMG